MVSTTRGCLDRARQLQKQGLCRWVGFSTHGSPELVEELCQGGRFDYVNLHWYYIFQSTPSLAAAQKNDMGIFIISPNDKGGMLYQPLQSLLKPHLPFPRWSSTRFSAFKTLTSTPFPSEPPVRLTSMNTSARFPSSIRQLLFCPH